MKKPAAVIAFLLILSLLISGCSRTAVIDEPSPSVEPPADTQAPEPEVPDEPETNEPATDPDPVTDPADEPADDPVVDPAEDPEATEKPEKQEPEKKPENEKPPEEAKPDDPKKPENTEPENDPAPENPTSTVDPTPSTSPGNPGSSSGIKSKPTTATATKAGAEATISNLYSNLAAGMSWGEVWDKYVYSGSKSQGYSKSSFINEREDYLNSYGIKYKGVKILSSEERKPGVFLVNGLLEYESNGQSVTENGSDYVVFENGEYYISLSGPLLGAAYTQCISTFPHISCLDAVVCEYDNRTVIECTLYNLSDFDYYMGYASGLPVTVTKNGETFSATATPGKISAGGYYAVNIELYGYKGMPDKVTLDPVIELLDLSEGTGNFYSMDILLYY
ncbi:MAG: hypothetical protein IKR21_06515 [Oscillospiraceae bacterium]|nr:hypothetical protein [Oscillospiraceae bacterium]